MAHKKPQGLKALLGSHRQHEEPEYSPLDREAPADVKKNPTAHAEWDRLIDELLNCNVLKAPDLSLFADYCKSYARVLDLEEKIDQCGLTLLDKQGVAKRNPLYLTLMNERHYLHALRVRLGFSPVDRAKVNFANKQEEGLDW